MKASLTMTATIDYVVPPPKLARALPGATLRRSVIAEKVRTHETEFGDVDETTTRVVWVVERDGKVLADGRSGHEAVDRAVFAWGGR